MEQDTAKIRHNKPDKTTLLVFIINNDILTLFMCQTPVLNNSYYPKWLIAYNFPNVFFYGIQFTLCLRFRGR